MSGTKKLEDPEQAGGPPTSKVCRKMPLIRDNNIPAGEVLDMWMGVQERE